MARRARTLQPTFRRRSLFRSAAARGPYRLSRNPSYVALSLLYVGIGVAADNSWIVAGLVPILIVMHYGVIVREEQYLGRV